MRVRAILFKIGEPTSTGFTYDHEAAASLINDVKSNKIKVCEGFVEHHRIGDVIDAYVVDGEVIVELELPLDYALSSARYFALGFGQIDQDLRFSGKYRLDYVARVHE